MRRSVLRERLAPAGLLFFVFLLVPFGRGDAEIRFRSHHTWERLVDPTRFPARPGFSSAVWDSLPADTTLPDSAAISAAAQDSVRAAADTSGHPSPEEQTKLPTAATGSDKQPDTSRIPLQRPQETTPDTSDSGRVAPAKDPVAKESPGFYGRADQPLPGEPPKVKEPLPRRSTQVYRIDMPVEFAAEVDTTTDYVILNHRLSGSELPVRGAMTKEAYLARMEAQSDRDSWRNAVIDRLPKKEESEGTGINISIPVFRSKRAQQIFGGSNVGLSVTGDISIRGSLSTEKREELRHDNPNPTNVGFKIDQTQRFHIKGSVGEKVAVEIDQDSERLFEFENNLKVTYTGHEDEIIQSIQAGNVSLSLPGTKLVSASTQHEGLFGLKTESRIGGLKLTTIASLDKGEKHTKSYDAGSERAGWKRIDPKDFEKNRYFSLDHVYRNNYRHYNPSNYEHYLVDQERILELEVYKTERVSGGDLDVLPGWALYDPSDVEDGELDPSDRDKEEGLFRRLEPGTEYTFDLDLGWVRLAQRLDDTEVLAVAYRTQHDTLGDIIPPASGDSAEFILKLVKPKNPQPEDTTWTLMWRHVYNLGAAGGIDYEGFEGRIVEDKDTRSPEGVNSDNIPMAYITMFGLDNFGETGEISPDNKIDRVFIRTGLGELHFPSLAPFSKDPWYLAPPGIEDDPQTVKLDTSFLSPEMYTETESEFNQIIPEFEIEVKYTSASATYDLGFNLLEGSEEVILNGRRLNRGTDYSIDYITGELTILNREALAADAKLDIKYETGQMFQLDTKTMLGFRAEYELWDDSFIGGTFMHLSQKGLDRRVRISADPPMKNTIWDMNAAITFRPNFLTRAVDWLPLIETNEESRLSFEGEVAQVFPNPNTLDNASTGDNNGVAYIDDFESIKRTMPLGVTRRQWTAASFPTFDSRGQLWRKQRGRMLWYNPWDQIKITDIWPEREVQAQESTIPVLRVEFQPWWTVWGASPPTEPGFNPRRSWGGVMRYLGAGFADQTQSKYIEIWLNRGSANGVMYLDLGQISEDVIPDNQLNTEDEEIPGKGVGNNALDDGEDIGIDVIRGDDPADSIDVNGDGMKLPSYDDYTYNPQRDKYDYTGINGTEDNARDEGGRYPDTEDLDGDYYLDQVNSLFRYRIDLSEGDNNRYIVGGTHLSEGRDTGWRLYRIPLADTLQVGRPSMNAIEYARIWFTGFERTGWLQIAQMEIVGNEWQEVEADDEGRSVEPVSITVINTHDNPEYEPPPGVSGELDPVTGLRAQEQALVMKVNRLGTGEIGEVEKIIPRGRLDLLEYRYLKMFVHGGGIGERLSDRFGKELDLEMYLRFGSDSKKTYYEYSQRIQPGWHENNEIVIDLDRLASLKFLRESDSLRNYDILPDGDVIRVEGDASLSDIKEFVIGIKNHGTEINPQDEIEIWLDEMRVSDINRDPGWAARGSVDLQVADLFSVRADMTQEQANFHNINKRKGNDEDVLRGSARLKFDLDKFFDPNLGLRIPVSISADQDVSIPKYEPGSDIKLSAITGRKLDVWDIFMENLETNQLMSNNPVYRTPADSMISVKKGINYSLDISKTKKSSNPLLAYTVDRIRLGASHGEDLSSDDNNQYRRSQQNRGQASYDLSFDEPLEIRWLGWAKNIPVLKKVSESLLRPLPSTVRLSANGTETYDISKSRRGGRINERNNFAFDRSWGGNWRPLEILDFNFNQQVNADRIRNDSLRTFIAELQVDLDSTDFYIDGEDSIPDFDSSAYAKAYEQEVERIRDELFWDLFGAKLVDHSLSQSFSANFTPRLISWLSTEANYNSRYRWDWSETYGRGDRAVNVNASLSTSLTLRLQEILRGWQDGGAAVPGGKPGYDMPGYEEFDEGEFDRDVPPSPEGFQPPGMGGSIPPPRAGFQPPGGASDTGGTTGLPDSLKKATQDSLDGESEAKADTTKKEKKRPRLKIKPLKVLKTVLGKLRDIRWEYTRTNDWRNYSVGPGQANWDYRLGFSDNPGLGRVPGYGQRDGFGNRNEHRFSSGLEISRTLSLSSLSFNFSNSRSGTIDQNETGTVMHTVFPVFASDDQTINALPALNWSARWSGLGELEFVKKFATSVNVENSFQGSVTESWKLNEGDSARVPTRFEYEKSFSPLVGLSISWLHGIGSNMRYNHTVRISDDRVGAGTKSRSTSQTISVSGSYQARGGIKLPIPIWPFNKRLKNNTSFSLNYSYTMNKRETLSEEGFSVTDESSQWSVSPRMEYSFSRAVRGSFSYEYGAQNTLRTGKTKTQEFMFEANISIRG